MDNTISEAQAVRIVASEGDIGPQLADIQRRFDRIERQQQGRATQQREEGPAAYVPPPHRRI